MLNPSYTNQFKKDLKKLLRGGKDEKKIKTVIEKLIDKKNLEEKYKDHKLIGNYKYRRECPIESDWLLIYKIDKKEIIFERTGSHSQLFG